AICLVILTRPPHSRTLLPYTTLFRSVVYPDAETIVLVVDNLNIHSPACLYERFEPAEARRLAEKFEWHYTPEHASWLNIAECERSEEHTSELQSRENLVCRLLLEKKK